MSIAEFVISRFGESLHERRPHTAAHGRVAARGDARSKNRLLAALEAHTYRQIELALGERAGEFTRAVRENRARETPKEQVRCRSGAQPLSSGSGID